MSFKTKEKTMKNEEKTSSHVENCIGKLEIALENRFVSPSVGEKKQNAALMFPEGLGFSFFCLLVTHLSVSVKIKKI